MSRAVKNRPLIVRLLNSKGKLPSKLQRYTIHTQKSDIVSLQSELQPQKQREEYEGQVAFLPVPILLSNWVRCLPSLPTRTCSLACAFTACHCESTITLLIATRLPDPLPLTCRIPPLYLLPCLPMSLPAPPPAPTPAPLPAGQPPCPKACPPAQLPAREFSCPTACVPAVCPFANPPGYALSVLQGVAHIQLCEVCVSLVPNLPGECRGGIPKGFEQTFSGLLTFHGVAPFSSINIVYFTSNTSHANQEMKSHLSAISYQTRPKAFT
jgi:hypothetical protein